MRSDQIMADEFELSKGGANHQKPKGDNDVMTTAQGQPIADNQNWLTAGPRGPQLLEDHIAREKIFAFDHERIPERVVHARGYGVHGNFELKKAIPQYSRAKIFNEVGNTPSTMAACRVAVACEAVDKRLSLKQSDCLRAYTRAAMTGQPTFVRPPKP